MFIDSLMCDELQIFPEFIWLTRQLREQSQPENWGPPSSVDIKEIKSWPDLLLRYSDHIRLLKIDWIPKPTWPFWLRTWFELLLLGVRYIDLRLVEWLRLNIKQHHQCSHWSCIKVQIVTCCCISVVFWGYYVLLRCIILPQSVFLAFLNMYVHRDRHNHSVDQNISVNTCLHRLKSTLTAPAKPLPESSAPVVQGYGQKARFKKRSISSSAADVHVFSTLPSGLMRASLGSPCNIFASGSLAKPTHSRFM